MKDDFITYKEVGLSCCTCQSSILENTLPSVFEVKADFNADKESGIALLHMSVIYARKHTIPCFLGNGRPLILTKRVGVCCAGRRWNGWHGEGPRIRNRKRNCRHSETSVPTWMRKSRRIWPTGWVCPPPSPPSLSLFFYFLLYSQLFSHAVCRRMSTAMFCFRLAFCTELFHAFSLDYYDGNIAHTTEDSPIPVVRGNDKQLLTTELPSADWKCDRCVQ